MVIDIIVSQAAAYNAKLAVRNNPEGSLVAEDTFQHSHNAESLLAPGDPQSRQRQSSWMTNKRRQCKPGVVEGASDLSLDVQGEPLKCLPVRRR